MIKAMIKMTKRIPNLNVMLPETSRGGLQRTQT